MADNKKLIQNKGNLLFQNSEISLEYPEPKSSGNYVISSLDLHDGTFLFSYVSAFLSYVTPQELPVGM